MMNVNMSEITEILSFSINKKDTDKILINDCNFKNIDAIKKYFKIRVLKSNKQFQCLYINSNNENSQINTNCKNIIVIYNIGEFSKHVKELIDSKNIVIIFNNHKLSINDFEQYSLQNC